MASEYAAPHLANCNCVACQSLQPGDQTNPYETAIVAMPRDRKDHVNEDSYEDASDSDNDRAKKDERIRQAPYLPRVQVWARDNGPYTLRVGNQWFHCDDLLINGGEYRQQVRKAATTQPPRPAPNGNQSGASPARRAPLNRAQSYQRTRPDNAPTSSRPTGALARLPSRDKVERTGRYESQALPDPRRKHGVKKPAQRRPKEAEGLPSAMKSDVNVPMTVPSGSLIPYRPPPTDIPPAYPSPSPKQARPARPGRLSRGNSYQIPVRSHGRKAVRFAPLPG